MTATLKIEPWNPDAFVFPGGKNKLDVIKQKFKNMTIQNDAKNLTDQQIRMWRKRLLSEMPRMKEKK